MHEIVDMALRETGGVCETMELVGRTIDAPVNDGVAVLGGTRQSSPGPAVVQGAPATPHQRRLILASNHRRQESMRCWP
jgi:hypothetical protein